MNSHIVRVGLSTYGRRLLRTALDTFRSHILYKKTRNEVFERTLEFYMSKKSVLCFRWLKFYTGQQARLRSIKENIINVNNYYRVRKSFQVLV